MRRGFTDHLPFMPSTFVWGVIFGAAATVAGIPQWYSTAMSAIVFSGTAQLAVLPVVHAGALAIFLTSFVVSLRFVPMVLSLAPRLPPGRWLRAGVLAGIVDAGFALAARRPADGELPRYVLGTTIGAYLSWLGGTIVGAVVGPVIPPDWAPVASGVITVLFIGLTVDVVHSRAAALAAATGAGVAVLLGRFLPAGIALATAAAIASVVLLPLEKGTE